MSLAEYDIKVNIHPWRWRVVKAVNIARYCLGMKDFWVPASWFAAMHMVKKQKVA